MCVYYIYCAVVFTSILIIYKCTALPLYSLNVYAHK